MKYFVWILLHYYYFLTIGQKIKSVKSRDSDIDFPHEIELERQNQITKQILENYLRRKLFPKLTRFSKVPSIHDILIQNNKNSYAVNNKVHNNNIQDILSASPIDNETLETVETEHISHFIDKEISNRIVDNIPTVSMPLLTINDNKRIYLGIFFKTNWFKASIYCRFHGMHLVSISSQEENDRLQKIIDDAGFGNEHFWTSGTDLAEESVFYWMSTGSPITFTNWNTGEPNNYRYENGEEENCLELWNRDQKGLKWNDSACSFETYFICEL